jgi:DNA-directed RNA polymerase specialized sigma subunit
VRGPKENATPSTGRKAGKAAATADARQTQSNRTATEMTDEFESTRPIIYTNINFAAQTPERASITVKDPAIDVQIHDDLLHLFKYIEELPDLQHDVLILSCFGLTDVSNHANSESVGISAKEIAELLNVSADTVKRALNLARVTLRKHFGSDPFMT